MEKINQRSTTRDVFKRKLRTAKCSVYLNVGLILGCIIYSKDLLRKENIEMAGRILVFIAIFTILFLKYYFIRCSKCNNRIKNFTDEMKFCPHCGESFDSLI